MFYLFIYTIMNNINTSNKNDNPKKYNSWRNLWYALILAWLLNVNAPTYANSNNYKNITTDEQVSYNANSVKWIELPSIYQYKLDNLLANNNVMKDDDAKIFTISFVEKEMEADWWINKENQLLFIRHSIYKQLTDQDLYDGKDGNQQIAEDFSNRGVTIRIRACWQKYKNWIIAYMNELSAEARQQSAEAIKKIMQQDSIRLKKSMIEFYEIYITNPKVVKKGDIDFAKESTKTIIGDCKKYWVDYKAILLKEVWDMKKVDAILKFYGVE